VEDRPVDFEKVDKLIERVELFHGLNREELVKIFSKGMTMRVTKGETIFHNGTVGSQMYVVLGGKVGIFDGSKLLAELHTGDMFGEMALVNQEPRSASVVAMEESKLFVLSENTFQQLLSKRVAIQILLNIVHSLSNRLKNANAKI
jgi:CRP-like cAMP-binding protein